jgi:DHA2 family multidrug resistance protein
LSGKEPGKWLITLTVMGGTLMGAIDVTIVNVAIPHIQGNVGASVEEITWVSTGYILSSVIIMPIAAFLSSRFGRKRLYLFSIVLFTAGSAVCGLSSSLSLLVSARIVQGVGGGGLYPLAQAILRETFPPEEQGMAMGVYGLGVVMGPALGPPLGGWLTDHYSWPWIFFVNIPIGVVAVSMVVRFIQDPPYLERERGRVDYPGLAFMIVGLGALQLLLEQGQRKDWFESAFIVYLAVVASLGLLLFVWREWTCDRPAVDLRILKNPSFTSGCLIVGILTVGQYGTLFLFPLFLQDLLGYNAFDSGLALMPRFLAMAVTMPVAGRLYNRIGPRSMAFLGILVCGFSFWELSRLSLDVGFWDIFIPQLYMGAGFGLMFVALSTAALSTIAKPRMTAATGLYNVLRQVAGSIGIAFTATQYTGWTKAFAGRLSENVTLSRDAVGQLLPRIAALLASRGANPADSGLQALKLIKVEVVRQASMLSMNRLLFLIACFFFLSLPLILLLKHGDRPA